MPCARSSNQIASGVLLFALDRDVARALSSQFEQGDITKRYLAIVRGYQRLFLAATDMQLAHPVSGQALQLQAGLAEGFAEVIGKLGRSEATHGIS